MASGQWMKRAGGTVTAIWNRNIRCKLSPRRASGVRALRDADAPWRSRLQT